MPKKTGRTLYVKVEMTIALGAKNKYKYAKAQRCSKLFTCSFCQRVQS